MDSQDLKLASKVHEIMLEAMDAKQKSTCKLRKLQQGVDYLQSGTEVIHVT
jgi:hypothetical protein